MRMCMRETTMTRSRQDRSFTTVRMIEMNVEKGHRASQQLGSLVATTGSLYCWVQVAPK